MKTFLTLVHFLHATEPRPFPPDGDLVSVRTSAWSMRALVIRRPFPPLDTVRVSDETATDEHVAAFHGSDWWDCADVLVGPGGAPPRSAGWHIAAVFAPNGRCLLLTRTGWAAELTPQAVPPRQGLEEPFGLYASFIHAWSVSGRPLAALDQAVLSVRGAVHRLDGGSASRAAS
jgi:hypothetical protein